MQRSGERFQQALPSSDGIKESLPSKYRGQWERRGRGVNRHQSICSKYAYLPETFFSVIHLWQIILPVLSCFLILLGYFYPASPDTAWGGWQKNMTIIIIKNTNIKQGLDTFKTNLVKVIYLLSFGKSLIKILWIGLPQGSSSTVEHVEEVKSLIGAQTHIFFSHIQAGSCTNIKGSCGICNCRPFHRVLRLIWQLCYSI